MWCFQNKYVVFQKRITSSFEIQTKVFSMPMQVNLRIISRISEIKLETFINPMQVIRRIISSSSENNLALF